MDHASESYNLLEQRWIPVLWTNGKVGRVGIRTALMEAGRIRQIAASNPMDRVAILRFLLALLYWCTGNPPDQGSVITGDPFPADWLTKLDANRDCFNLLGEGKRFYQFRESAAAGHEKLTSNYLIHEIPTGTNKWHFRHSTDSVDGLCRACCAMGLLRLPMFATSGGRGKPPGINAKPPLYVIPTGPSLAETLRLSWRKVSGLGTPAWEGADPHSPEVGDVPLLVGLTWLPRRVWLDDPGGPETNCISCGSREHLIRQCVFAGIGSTKTDEGAPSRIWRDPHVVYSRTAQGDLTSLHASDVIGSSDAAAGQWTKIIAGMLSEQKASYDGCSVWIVGFATVQNDKYLEAMEHVVPYPCASRQIEESIEKVRRWQKEGSDLVRKIRLPNEKASSRKHVEIPPMVAAIRPHVEDRVSARAGEMLAGDDGAWQQAADEYRPMMRAIGKSLSPGFTTAAVERRKYIAGVTPDMRPKAEPAKKTRRKKGDVK